MGFQNSFLTVWGCVEELCVCRVCVTVLHLCRVCVTVLYDDSVSI
jgi:hypothetical protein